MIEKDTVRELVERVIGGSTFFLVDLSVSPSNRISILVDSPGGITIDECAVINRKLELLLDRNKEDYELVVSSPGLGSALKVTEQYHKNVGRELEIVLKDHTRHNGILKLVGRDGIVIESEIKKSGGKKYVDGNETGSMEQRINFNDIKTAKVRIIF